MSNWSRNGSSGRRIGGSSIGCTTGGNVVNGPGSVGQKFFFTTPSGLNTITSRFFGAVDPAPAKLGRLPRKGSTAEPTPSRRRSSRRETVFMGFSPGRMPVRQGSAAWAAALSVMPEARLAAAGLQQS